MHWLSIFFACIYFAVIPIEPTTDQLTCLRKVRIGSGHSWLSNQQCISASIAHRAESRNLAGAMRLSKSCFHLPQQSTLQFENESLIQVIPKVRGSHHPKAPMYQGGCLLCLCMIICSGLVSSISASKRPATLLHSYTGCNLIIQLYPIHRQNRTLSWRITVFSKHAHTSDSCRSPGPGILGRDSSLFSLPALKAALTLLYKKTRKGSADKRALFVGKRSFIPAHLKAKCLVSIIHINCPDVTP